MHVDNIAGMSAQPIELERGWLLVDMDTGAVMNPYYWPTAKDAIEESTDDPSWEGWTASNHLKRILFGTAEWKNSHIDMLKGAVNDWRVNQLAVGGSQLLDIFNVGSILDDMAATYGGGKDEYGCYIDPYDSDAIWLPGVPNEPYLLAYINNYIR